MNYCKYKVKYHWYKEGFETDDEEIVMATSTQQAIDIIEEKCALNYMSCHIKSVEEIDSYGEEDD